MLYDPTDIIIDLLQQILRELENITASCSSIESNTQFVTDISIAVDDIKENM